MGSDGRPRLLQHKTWFDPSQEPFSDERNAYQALVWQCRFSGIEVPNHLWRHADIGLGKPYADDQADQIATEQNAVKCFDDWTDAFVEHVNVKGIVPGTTAAAEEPNRRRNE